MSDFTFRFDPKGVAEMAVGEGVSSSVRSIAEEAKGIAEGLAESFRSDEDHPHYADSFEVDVEVRDLPAAGISPSHPAAVGILRNTSGHAIAVEYGYAGRADETGRKPHRVFGRTFAALGA